MVYGQVLHHSGPDDSFLNLNVGGYKQRVARTMLQSFPHTRLGRLVLCHSEAAILELCDDYSAREREYYFDRNPRFFCYVLNFYHTGHIHLMEELCVFSFSQELEYWGISELHLDSCCSSRFHEQKDGSGHDWLEDEVLRQQLRDSSESSTEESSSDSETEKFEGTWCSEGRRELWLHLENPTHSRAAKVLALVSLAMVLTSIIAMCVHSMPEFHRLDNKEKPVEDPVLAAFETVSVLWFTVEFVARLATTPCFRKFARNTLNVIDLVSIVPFYATLVLEAAHAEESQELENVGRVVQVLRLMRVFRVLKLARHSVGLRSLGATLRHSYHEVSLLVLFLAVGISIFSVLIYFVEKEEDESELQTIPVGWWWATISMTTVGYGDTCPITLAGKLVGTICIICGLLVVALPVSTIFNKFSKYYERQKALVLADQFAAKNKGPVPGLLFFDVKDLYSHGSLLASRSSSSSVTSGGDTTDVSSTQDIDAVHPAGLSATCKAT
ncbi:potassium voltage-gated channel subfamily S member 3a [Electrophorus electricus]|uniref:BTB domain-containing protein n=1 Tax=Electrophorus electricus TaxID=8005 RepID=A0A4W4HCY8_ELEEL|nr:potassium voltage-gated channel subfamily S member 3a [Electrophorus electricus]XP_026864013.2 potassium voltage-gated channel subfamily S member 3a [Electrophorus electricus]